MISVSVILPIYNAESYVKESIESILNQSFSDLELIIINDGSTDGSEKVILTFKDERIKYVKNETNLKLIETLNVGLKLAKGKYIARIDSDDISFSDRLEKQVRFLEKNLDFGLVGSFAECFGDSRETLKYVEEDQDIRYALLTHNPFIHSSIMFRSSILHDHCLQYQNNQLHVEDYDLWIRMLSFTKAKIIPECLIKYRMHENQISTVHRDLQSINTLDLQQNYFKIILKGTPSLDELCAFFYEGKIDVFILDTFLKNRRIIRATLTNNLQLRIFKNVETKFRDAYLLKKRISIKQFVFLVLFSDFFSLKQKVVLLFKLF